MDQTKQLFPVEEQFMTTADMVPVLIRIAGLDKLYYFFNAGWLKFTGRTMKDEYGKGWTKGVHPDDLKRCLDIYTISFDAQKEFKMEYRLKRHDGQYRWLLDNGVPRFTADGIFAGYISSCIDIDELLESERLKNEYIRTEALENEQALNEELATTNEELSVTNEELLSINEELNLSNEELQQSRASLALLNTELEKRVNLRTAELSNAQAEAESQRDRLKRFFMQAPAGICMLDGPELVFELVNPSYQQLFSGRSLLGKPILEAVPEIRGTSIWNILQDVYQSGKTFEGNELPIPLVRHEGGLVEDRYFNFIYQARYDARNMVDGILVFVIEVTDIVQTKRQVQESELRFRTLLNAIPQIAWTNTIDGSVNYYNQQWYDYTGLDFEQTKAWGWKNVIHPNDLQYNLDSYQSILQSGQGGGFEVREKRTDGVYRWHLVRIQPVKNEKGEIQFWIGTATDIHEIKLLQQQKDDFISIASHELKTPVTSLKASLQLLDRLKNQQTFSDMVSKLIEQSNKSMQKISSLIGDLLDASRMSESQLHLNKTTFTVFDMLNGCCNHVRAVGEYKLVLQGDKKLQIFADEHRIDQVVVNLVNNVVKYAPESKNIFLTAEKVGQNVKISVRDTGPGIAPDKIPHLFERYYRTDYKGEQYSGLGLGLYISAEIVKRHGGQIGVDSVLGKGSTFWFTLPINY
ncbi:MAG: hypothetical protein JWQ06_287 [Mucilaginibacter sp.]|nr:hypothetical protein [Mucilaginibacter sp.]